MFKKVSIGLIAGLLLFSATNAHAEVRTYEGVGEYVMSDFETMDIAKQRAKQYAERNAQEQAGVYVQSVTKVLDSKVTSDEITTITNGILKVTEVNYTMIPLDNNSIMFRATIKANIETNDIDNWLDRSAMEREELINQNQELQKAIEDQEKVIADLRSQLENLQTQQDRDQIAYEYIAADNGFRSNQKLEQAGKYFERGDYASAITLLNESIALNVNNASAYLMRGSSYGNLQSYNAALNDFNMAIQLGLNNSLIYYCRGLLYEKLGDFSQSIPDLNRSIEMNPTYVDAYYSRGLAYIKTENFTAAIEDFNKAIQISPSMAKAYYCRGYCYQMLDYTLQANNDFAIARDLGYNY